METPNRLEFIFRNLEGRKQHIYFLYPRDYTRSAEFFGRVYYENPEAFFNMTVKVDKI